MKASDLKCWKCGKTLDGQILPLSRMAVCRHCHADLHVCRQCSFFDTTVSNSCREPVAERVTDKKKRNFCGYLQPSPDACRSTDSDSMDRTKEQLDALFGIDSGPDKPSGAGDAAEAARKKLEQLFKTDGDG